MIQPPKPMLPKKSRQPMQPAKLALQISVWLIFGAVAFAVPWADLLLTAAFLLIPAVCYAAVTYHFETQENPVKSNLAQLNTP
jgi:hypothetical protein